MTHLIRCFLDDVVNVIGKGINTEVLFHNNSHQEVQKISSAIKTCQILHVFYRKECIYLSNRRDCKRTWKVLSKTAIFSNVKLFQERCLDLILISNVFKKFENLPDITIIDNSYDTENNDIGHIGRKVLQIQNITRNMAGLS